MPLSRETRLNLIFLGLLLVTVAPGAVIMLRRQLSPQARRFTMRDVVHQQAAYCDGALTNPNVQRVVPQLTAAWVRQAADGNWKAGAAPERRFLGCMSLRRTFEVVAAGDDARGYLHLGLMVWDFTMSQHPGVLAFHADGGPWRVDGFAQVGMPWSVRRELQNLGFVDPPEAIAWFEIVSPRPMPVSAARGLLLECQFGQPAGRQDSCLLPPSGNRPIR